MIDRLKSRLQGFFTPLFWAISKRWQLRSILQSLAEKSNPWIFCRINTSHKLIIYTDASFHEGRKAGYAAVILDTVTGAEFYVGGSSDDITNSNRAELYAIISALRLIDERCKATVEIRTDAISLVKVAKPHNLRRLKKLGWSEQFCMNGDLWKEFYRVTIQRDIQVIWVKGHFRDRYNKLCDNIAGRCFDGELIRGSVVVRHGLSETCGPFLFENHVLLVWLETSTAFLLRSTFDSAVRCCSTRSSYATTTFMMFCSDVSYRTEQLPPLIKKDILRKKLKFTLPHPPPFLGPPVRSGTVKFNRMFLSKAGVQPLELSERAELESPPPLRGARGLF